MEIFHYVVLPTYLKHRSHQTAPVWWLQLLVQLVLLMQLVLLAQLVLLVQLPLQQVQALLEREGNPECRSPTPGGRSAPELEPRLEPELGQRWAPVGGTSVLRGTTDSTVTCNVSKYSFQTHSHSIKSMHKI